MEFSTYNESSLHRVIKNLYSEIYDGKTEVSLDGHIYDVVTKNNNVIEIQTKNLSSLYAKSIDAIKKGHNIKIVYPVPIKTKIKLYDSNNNLIKESWSSKRGSIYDIFSQLTKLYPVLLNSHFSLEVVEINMIEKRLKTEIPVQSSNGRRRFKKDWLKEDKILEEIIKTKIFNNKEDYLSLLPESLPEDFCAKDLMFFLKKEKLCPGRIYNNSNLIIWVLSKMNLITATTVKNRNHFYKINI